MGTNYYQVKTCAHCNHESERLHIGKSSAGWVFALCVHPEIGIHDLPDWEARWALPDTVIKNEYGEVVTPENMRSRITERGREKTQYDVDNPFNYKANHAKPGPKNLVRSKIDGIRCIGHGAGTWDLFHDEFS